MKKKKGKIMPFFKFLAIAMALITIITLCLFKFIDILPGEYFIVLCILLILIDVGLSLLILTRKGVKRRAVGSVLSIIYIIFLILAIIYELNTIGFLKKIGFTDYKTENYSVLVLKDSNYEEIEDLDGESIGSLEFNTDGLEKAKEKIEKEITPEFITTDNITTLKDDFLAEEYEGMLIEDSMLSMVNESDGEFSESYRVIYEFSVDVETENIAEEVNITEESFNIFISGIDTYGSISSVARSDVNMVITVNPNTHKILITSIPRDYYVTLAGKNAKDKLTHAGIYGIETSVGTIENLLDIKINYYIKVNFTSLLDIVEALGGVNVYSEYSFTSKDGYYYQKGYNNVDGKKALSFVRERGAFTEGDRVRVKNQAAMIEALINKAISPSIIVKYTSLLNALDGSFVTNIPTKDITDFIKKQIDEMPEWEFENISLDGSNGYDYTYSYGGTKLYVMIPDNETVINATNKINEVLKEE
ncbi:MAG TPA: LCP family protein [Candidatus Caccenecus avistercoris]|nr:LCP family protein [Candidatus Caccenecus avistercoris]